VWPLCSAAGFNGFDAGAGIPFSYNEVSMRMRKYFVIGMLLLVAAVAQAQQTTVILVRHAERADSPEKPQTDPNLSAAGVERANRLSEYLKNAGVSAIYSTPFARTRETAQPLAKALGITITETPSPSGKPLAEFTKELAHRILAENKGNTALVVGHSNTTPAMVTALGAPAVPPIADPDYGDTYIVTVYENGKATVIRAKH
jgi:2,3-bisphosphoglycerate-dependent phosphoglycerate mutase